MTCVSVPEKNDSHVGSIDVDSWIFSLFKAGSRKHHGVCRLKRLQHPIHTSGQQLSTSQTQSATARTCRQIREHTQSALRL